MNLIKLILSIQLLLAFLCLLIQMYALISAKWSVFEARVELGLLEEHGHYGLWSICTSRLLAPAEVTDDGRVVDHIADCEPMNTFFKPAYSRVCIVAIAIFAIAHTMALIMYICQLALRLVEILLQESKKESIGTDLEVNQSKVKRMLVIATRFFAVKRTQAQEDNVKRQIRIRLYTISVAAASTSLALLSAITPRKPLRESDPFQVNNVAGTNYRVWRGPAFWAQLTTLIMDMLVTSLIAIEVRVLFVLQQQQQITTTCGTSDNDQFGDIAHEVVVNPFFRVNSVHSPILSPATEERVRRSVPLPPDTQETSMSVRATTRPKMLARLDDPGVASASGDCSPSPSNTNHYVNSKEVRQLKKLMSLSRQQPSNSTSAESSLVATSYCNPMFNEHESEAQNTSTC